MSVILKQPPALVLVGNIEKIVIASTEAVAFRLLMGSVVLLDETYQPSPSNTVEVDIRDIIRENLNVSIPPESNTIFEQSGSVRSFTCQVDSTTFSFIAIKAGIDAAIDDTEQWLTSNWLTWQPQTQEITESMPLWLSYFATLQGMKVRVRGYFSDGAPQQADLATLSQGKVTTLNVRLDIISDLFPTSPGAYDLWVEDSSGQVLSYVQRFVFKHMPSDVTVFVFENSLGGLDTLLCKGVASTTTQYKPSMASQDDTLVEYHLEREEIFEQNTGILETRAAQLWLPDFLRSSQRWVVKDGMLKQIVLQDGKPKMTSRKGLTSASFSYKIARQSQYISIARSEQMGALLEITDPEGTLFFLTPRLIDFLPADPIDDLLFPVMLPWGEQWRRVSLGGIYQEIISRVGGGGPSGGTLTLVKTTSQIVGHSMDMVDFQVLFPSEEAASLVLMIVNNEEADVDLIMSAHAELYVDDPLRAGLTISAGEALKMHVSRVDSKIYVTSNVIANN